MSRSSRTLLCLGSALAIVLVSAQARGQISDAALKDRVAQLLDRLDSDKKETREAAEAALVNLGARIIPFLPESLKDGSAEKKERFERVKKRLRDLAAKLNLGASKITLKATGIRLSEAIQKLQASSGNIINDLREQKGEDTANPALDLDIADKPFLQALDVVARKAGVAVDFLTGDGTLGIVAGMPAAAAPKPDDSAAEKLLQYGGPFRVSFKRMTIDSDLLANSANGNAQFEVAWEPRLRPMLLTIKAEDLKIVDDRGKTVEPTVQEESNQVVLRPENPFAEFNLNFKAPERAAKEFASIKVKGEVTVPADLRAFRFPSLAGTNVSKKDGDLTVTLEGTEIDESVWKVGVVVQFPSAGGAAFDSYQQGLFNNRIWLQKADGSRFEHNGGFNNTGSDQGRLGFEYLFVDAPGKPEDYQLVYETPSQVLTIPLEFEFKKVPLP